MQIEKRKFSATTDATNNFDFLRLFFAFSVFVHHFAILTNNTIFWPISSQMAVAGFFVISGFLITKSFYRSPSIKNYLLKRIRRIVPAYFFIVLTCAIGLSTISPYSTIAYFTAADFWKYLLANLSFLNFIQPTLPGVFAQNPEPFVNGALWTIKVELMLYLSVPICAYLIRKIAFKWLFVVLYVLSFGFIQWMNSLYYASGNDVYLILNRQVIGQFGFFASGILLLFYFDFFQKNIRYFFPIAAVVVVLYCTYTAVLLRFLFPFSFAIVIIGIAYNFRYLNNVAKYGDISYGMYLFHYPIIQLVVASNFHQQHPINAFLLSLILVSVLSFASWHLLEKRFLKRRGLK